MAHGPSRLSIGCAPQLRLLDCAKVHLIGSIEAYRLRRSCTEVVTDIMTEAEALICKRLPALIPG